MKLSDLTPSERRQLAKKAGTNPVYLWQCATGRRSPSLKLIRRLVEADPRLNVESFVSEVCLRSESTTGERARAA